MTERKLCCNNVTNQIFMVALVASRSLFGPLAKS
jgi:hypothetical protein